MSDGAHQLLLLIKGGAALVVGALLAACFVGVRGGARGPWARLLLHGAPVVAAAFVGVVLVFAPPFGERLLNGVDTTGAYPRGTEAGRRLHAAVVVADAHADPLMWSFRDLLVDASGVNGHVDVPRLQRGNVAVQGLGLVTKVR